MYKNVIVTGSAGGIGRAAALRFAKHNVNLMLVDMLEDELKETARMVEELGSKAICRVADITKEEEVAAYVKECVDTFGSVDVVAHIAGVMPPMMPMADIDMTIASKIIDVNLYGTAINMKYAFRAMQQQETKGTFIATASTNSLYGCSGLGIYVASKMGVVGLVRCACYEHGRDGIRVSAVIPGSTDTRMIGDYKEIAAAGSPPMLRLADPDEVAAGFEWLASDDATYTNGTILPINGGLGCCLN